MTSTLPIMGIGTHLTSPYAIDTHADSVTYSAPELVAVPKFGQAYEIRGTITGTGWGGVSSVIPERGAIHAHYTYTIPFVARWAPKGPFGWTEDLVMFYHGGSQTVDKVLAADKVDGENNIHRFAERSGDSAYGLPALLNDCTYISTNRRGLDSDGKFSAIYSLDEVSGLTDDEARRLNGFVAAPGDPNYVKRNIALGAPVPLVPNTDVPTYRDISRALHRLVIGLVAATRTIPGVSNSIPPTFRT